MPRSPISEETKDRRRQASLLLQIEKAERAKRLKRWYIKGSHKPGTCKGDPMDWKSWRVFFAVPILFHSEEAAWKYGETHMFKNMKHLRKMSYSVEVRWLKD